MKINKRETETYVLTDLEALDTVTVYVANYNLGSGQIVIECYCQSWAYYWGGMGEKTLQEFFAGCDNNYILAKLLAGNTRETDFDLIHNESLKKGFDICASSDVEIAMCAAEMRDCFGEEWMMDLPTKQSNDYRYLDRIVDAVKLAFNESK